MNTLWFGIRWTQSSYLWITLFLIIIMACYLYRQHKVRCAIGRLGGKWQSFIVQNFSRNRQLAQAVFFGTALIFLGLAVLRPQWNKQENVIAQEGRDVLIGLDISRSMLAADCVPSRLSVAKKKIKQMLSMLDCERVGLMLFSGSAFVQCPLTTDYSSFHMFLDNVDVETISSGSTALDAALRTAIDSFGSGADRKNKILVLLTDGEDFSSNLMRIKEEAHAANMRIFTIGVGTPDGAPIPLYDDYGNQIGHQKDARGKVVISHLNSGILQTLSSDVGGIYLPVTQDKSDLEALISRITRFEKERFEDKSVHQYEDKYYLFALVSFLCLLMEWML